MSDFVLSELADTKVIQDSRNAVFTPLAMILNRLLNSPSAADALKGVEDLFKVTLQFSVLAMTAYGFRKAEDFPPSCRDMIRKKWLSGRHDLTEGERVAFIKAFVDSNRQATLSQCVVGSVLLNAFRGPWPDIDQLAEFKRNESHVPSGDIEWNERKLKGILPALPRFVERLVDLTKLDLIVVGPKECLRHFGMCPSRETIKNRSEGVHFEVEGQTLELSPLIRIRNSDAKEIQLFSRILNRETRNAEYRSIGAAPELDQDDGTAFRFLSQIAEKGEVSIRLVGLAAQTKQLSDMLRPIWTGAKESAIPVIVLGEEGTGKSALIRHALNESSDAFTVLRASGDETHGRPYALFMRLFYQLFSVEYGRDALVLEKLREQSYRLGVLCGNRIADWLYESESHLPRYGELEEQFRSEIGARRATERAEQLVNRNAADEVAGLYDDLFVFLARYSEEEKKSIVLWLEDAQKFEEQSMIQIEAFFSVFHQKKPMHLVLIGEFRADRSHDIERLRSTYRSLVQRPVVVENLKEKQLHELIAERIGVTTADLPNEVTANIFKKTGGNPKATLDILKIIGDRDSGDADQNEPSATEILLALPRILSEVRATNLKDMAKQRIATLALEDKDLDVLSVAAFLPMMDVPAELLDLILGDVGASIGKLENLGILTTDNDAEEWVLRFVHLAAKGAASEIARDRDSDDLQSLSRRVTAVRMEMASAGERRYEKEISGLNRKLAEIAKDPVALAPAVASAVFFDLDHDLQKLKSWASILKRALGSIDPSILILRNYVNARIWESEKGLDAAADKMGDISKTPRAQWESIQDRDSKQAVIKVMADAFGYCAAHTEGDTNDLARRFLGFCNLLLVTLGESQVNAIASIFFKRVFSAPQDRAASILVNLGECFAEHGENPSVALALLSQSCLYGPHRPNDKLVRQVPWPVLSSLIVPMLGSSHPLVDSQVEEERRRSKKTVSLGQLVLLIRAKMLDAPGADKAAVDLAKLAGSYQALSAHLLPVVLTLFDAELAAAEDRDAIASILAKYRTQFLELLNTNSVIFLSYVIRSAHRRGIPHGDLHKGFEIALQNTPPASVGEHLVTLSEAVAALCNDLATEDFLDKVVGSFDGE